MFYAEKTTEIISLSQAEELITLSRYTGFGARYHQEAQQFATRYRQNCTLFADVLHCEHDSKPIDFEHYIIPTQPWFSFDMFVDGYRFNKTARFDDKRAQFFLSVCLLAILNHNSNALKILLEINVAVFFLPIIGSQSTSLFEIAFKRPLDNHYYHYYQHLFNLLLTQVITLEASECQAKLDYMLNDLYQPSSTLIPSIVRKKCTEMLIEKGANPFAINIALIPSDTVDWFKDKQIGKVVQLIIDYINERTDERKHELIKTQQTGLAGSYYRFYEKHRPYSADEKIAAAQKLMAVLQSGDCDFLRFNDQELAILTNGRLKKIYQLLEQYNLRPSSNHSLITTIDIPL